MDLSQGALGKCSGEMPPRVFSWSHAWGNNAQRKFTRWYAITDVDDTIIKETKKIFIDATPFLNVTNTV